VVELSFAAQLLSPEQPAAETTRRAAKIRETALFVFFIFHTPIFNRPAGKRPAVDS
jgi:hypothetical protein